MQKFFRIILASTFVISTFGFVEQSALAATVSNVSHEIAAIDAAKQTQSEAHDGPHIPAPKGDIIEGLSVFGLPVTNTILSTWIFMGVLFVLVGFMYIAIRTEAMPRLRAFGLDIIERIYVYALSLIGDEKITKNFIWLLGGLIVVIFLGNLMGLIFDWLVLISTDEWLGHYLRPIYSDLSTTLVFSLTVILMAQLTAFYLKGPLHHLGHYLFNYHGDTTAEKIV